VVLEIRFAGKESGHPGTRRCGRARGKDRLYPFLFLRPVCDQRGRS